MPMSPHALTKFVTNVDALVTQRARGMMTDEEYFTEILAATVACQQTSDLHENPTFSIASWDTGEQDGEPFKPRYVHDCDDGCEFLGFAAFKGRTYDAYRHIREGRVEYIARASSEPSDYLSTSDWGSNTVNVYTTDLGLIPSPLGQVIVLAKEVDIERQSEQALEDLRALINRPSNRKRMRFDVYIDLDPIPGTCHTQESMQNVLRNVINDRLGHYTPMVSPGKKA